MDNKLNGSIYVIRNDVNGKVYVGQTTGSVKSRFDQHIKASRSPERYNQAILWAIHKYGAEHFKVETIVSGIGNRDELNALEEHYIQELHGMKPEGYNLCPGGAQWRRPVEPPDMRIVDAYLSGKSVRAVAEEFGCSATKVKKHVLKSGNEMRRNNNPYSAHASVLTEAELRRMYLDEGMTDADISKAVGISERYVRKRRQIFNIHRI